MTRLTKVLLFAVVIIGSNCHAQELSSYRQKYDDAVEKISADHQQRVGGITKTYSSSLNALKARAQSAGNLNKVKAVMEEISRFKMDQTFPTTEATLTPEIMAVLKDCNTSITKADQSKAERTVALASLYDKALLRLQKKLTRKGELDKATVVQEERTKLTQTETLVAARSLISEDSKKQTVVSPPPVAKRPPPPRPELNDQGKAGTITVADPDKAPVKDALVVVYDAGKNSVVEQDTTDSAGKANVTVNIEAKYDLIVFHENHSFLLKRNVRLAKPLNVALRSLPKGMSIAVVSGAGISLFGDKEKDIQIGTTYGGHTSCDFRCMNDETLIGFDKPKLTTIQRCRPGQEFVVKKGKAKATCEVLWSLPSGFVVEYKVSP